MKYLSERIININEHEKIISDCRLLCDLIKSSNDFDFKKQWINELDLKLHELQMLGFHLERREVDYCE